MVSQVSCVTLTQFLSSSGEAKELAAEADVDPSAPCPRARGILVLCVPFIGQEQKTWGRRTEEELPRVTGWQSDPGWRAGSWEFSPSHCQGAEKLRSSLQLAVVVVLGF